MSKKTITGFSKLSKRGKIKWIVENFFSNPETVMHELKSYWLDNEEQQKILDGISENTISIYPLPYGVAPNFQMNGKTYALPMVTEESSVVAAASSAAKFWQQRGGFHAKVVSTEKVGQIHFLWTGDPEILRKYLDDVLLHVEASVKDLTLNMEKRGGGIKRIELKNLTKEMKDYYQLVFFFETCDSMGANFINTVLERASLELTDYFARHPDLLNTQNNVEIIMSILSNYTPDCIVEAWVECPIEDLGSFDSISSVDFARRFCQAVQMSKIDPYRATTHNKGIFNGVDAVVIATANDFRAIEACGHAYASRDGQYRGLTNCSLEDGIFRFSIRLPLAVGTVGGLTVLHPVAKRSMELLGNPNATELMEIIAAAGLAQNFAALRSLVTTGIQKGHMKMHLMNILNHLKADQEEVEAAKLHFEGTVVSYDAVRSFLENIRKGSVEV